jgi:hypothetical protein
VAHAARPFSAGTLDAVGDTRAVALNGPRGHRRGSRARSASRHVVSRRS